jgi:hypothetical protein
MAMRGLAGVVAGLLAGLGLWMVAPTRPGAEQHAAITRVSAEAGGQPVAVTFDFEMAGLPVPHWAIAVQQDGSGRYDDLSHSNQATDQTRQPIHVEAATRRRLDAGLNKVASGNCAKVAKNIANTGTKRIAYRSSGDAWVSCTFNYTEDRGLEDAVAAFQAIAQTLQEGDRLEHSHRFDRLGLDEDVDDLTKEIKEGEAIEIENIAPVLQSIVQDERVMERVRRKAARLLQDGAEATPIAAN